MNTTLATADFTGSNSFPSAKNEGTPPARLIDGARRGPLEDSGGFPGYEEIMDALADPSHPATVGKATALNWRSSEQTELDVPAAQAISVQP